MVKELQRMADLTTRKSTLFVSTRIMARRSDRPMRHNMHRHNRGSPQKTAFAIRYESYRYSLHHKLTLFGDLVEHGSHARSLRLVFAQLCCFSKCEQLSTGLDYFWDCVAEPACTTGASFSSSLLHNSTYGKFVPFCTYKLKTCKPAIARNACAHVLFNVQ